MELDSYDPFDDHLIILPQLTKEMSRTGNVKVAFRLRPFTEEKEDNKEYSCIHLQSDRGRVVVRTNDESHHFRFDRVLDDEATQLEVYTDTAGFLVADFVAGRNCCVLAYGEQGSGKTYTMMGPPEEDDFADLDDEHDGVGADDAKSGVSSLGSAGVSRHPDLNTNPSLSIGGEKPPTQVIASSRGPSPMGMLGKHLKRRGVQTDKPLFDEENSGLAPRVVRGVFEMFRKRRKRLSNEGEQPTLMCSFVQIYLEKVFDLLDPDTVELDDDDRPTLNVRSDRDKGVHVENAVELKCSNEEDVLKAIQQGVNVRDELSSQMDTDASRSHSILILKIERYSRSRGRKATSNFFLVDLANSALVRKPSSEASDIAIRESKAIKRSLGALRKCLRSLSIQDKTPTPPYGESTLTKLLHDSLQKGAGVFVVVTANPCEFNALESLSAIKFGSYVSGMRVDDGGESTLSKSRSQNDLKQQPRRSHTGHSQETQNTRTTKALRRASDSHHSLLSSGNHRDSTYAEIEKAQKVLRGESSSQHSRKRGNKEAKKQDLDQVSELLESAARRMEADLTDAKEELKASGIDDELSASQMEKQLMEVTKELESMKYDGHLTSQIHSDLAAAQEELRRLASNVTTSKRRVSVAQKSARSNIFSIPSFFGANGEPRQETDMEAMKRELQLLRIENKALQRKQESQEKELVVTRQKLKELGGDVDTTDTHPMSALSSDNETSLTAGRQFQLAFGENFDPWDDPKVEVGLSPIQVCLRLRPMTRLERNRRSRSCIEVDEDGRNFTVDSPLDGEYDFCFDHAFDIDTTQEELYESVGLSMVENLLAGVNCAVLVYGLTGSGKSHTLVGKLPDSKDDESLETSSDEDTETTDATPNEEDAGFALRIISDLFRGMKETYSDIEFRITCSFVCIYLEKMIDLLEPRFDKHLWVKDTAGGVQIDGAVEAFCFSDDDVIHLLRRGTACRKIIGTKLKLDHNRSHSILTLNIEQRHTPTGSVKRSYLQLAELAGFEVSSKAKGQSVQETKIIHKSFSALGNVIKSLTEGNHHAPYRESKLTSILKDAFGGNCKTTLFITASPSSYNISETINSIRLGQRVKRVTNHPRFNTDASIADYRKWMIRAEARLGEVTGYLKEFAKDLVEISKSDPSIEKTFSKSTWSSLRAIVDEEEVVDNPLRRNLFLADDENPRIEKPKWRFLTLALSKRMPSDKLVEAIRSRDRAESMLTDIQSESVVLRRQNELLVQERRKKEDELGAAHRDNKKITLQNAELEHKLSLAESRAKEAINFLRYLRTLCWKLRKDVEKDRPIEINEITASLHNAPDLSGLVDLDTLMIDAGLLVSKEMDIEQVETEFFDYLQQAGLILDDNKAAEEDEIDQLDGLDGDIVGGSSESRWGHSDGPRANTKSDHSTLTDTSTNSSQHEPNLFGLQVPWLRKEHKDDEKTQQPVQPKLIYRNTRREHELQRDLQNMANKCVELQVALNEQRQLIEGMTGRTGPLSAVPLNKKKVSPEVVTVTKERDRMMHNALAAAWKLQELHVTNKLLFRQANENKQHVKFLEESFSRLQESLRGSIQNGIDADAELRDRVKTLQSLLDSLTGPLPDEEEENSEYSYDTMGEQNLLSARFHLPPRGKLPPKDLSPSDDLFSNPKCLTFRYKGKRKKKRLEAFVHHTAKFIRKQRSTGTALIGKDRVKLQEAFKRGKVLLLPLFEDVDEDGDSVTTDDDDEYYDD